MIFGVLFDGLNKAFTDMVFESVSVTQGVAITGLLIFTIAEFGITIVRFFSGSGEQFPSFQKPLGYIVLFFFLLCFVPVMRTFDSTINKIDSYIRQKGETNYASIAKDLILLKNVEKSPVLLQASQDASQMETAFVELANVVEHAKTVFNNTLEFFSFSLPSLLWASIADGITGVIRYVVEVLSIMLTSVLIVVGPLAIMFQTAPFIGDGVLKNWFGAWLSIKCWLITMSIIDLMMHKFLILFTTQPRGTIDFYSNLGTSAATMSLVMNVAFIVLFIMTPFITNYWVKGGGGAFMSKMIGAATTVVSSATSVATLGSSGTAQKMLGGAFNGINEKLDNLNKHLSKKS